MNKSKFTAIGASLTALLLLSGCLGAPETQPNTLVYGVELWGSNFTKTSDNHCKDIWGLYQNNESIALVGPDDSEISSAIFTFGDLQPSRQDPDDVENFPEGDICYFEVAFPDVPVVATYRMKTSNGNINPLSFSINQIEESAWSIFSIYGAEFKQ